jgi:hypothetical protein
MIARGGAIRFVCFFLHGKNSKFSLLTIVTYLSYET